MAFYQNLQTVFGGNFRFVFRLVKLEILPDTAQIKRLTTTENSKLCENREIPISF